MAFKDVAIDAAIKAAEEAHEKGLKHNPRGGDSSAGHHIISAVRKALNYTGTDYNARINDASEIGANHFKMLQRNAEYNKKHGSNVKESTMADEKTDSVVNMYVNTISEQARKEQGEVGQIDEISLGTRMKVAKGRDKLYNKEGSLKNPDDPRAQARDYSNQHNHLKISKKTREISGGKDFGWPNPLTRAKAALRGEETESIFAQMVSEGYSDEEIIHAVLENYELKE